MAEEERNGGSGAGEAGPGAKQDGGSTRRDDTGQSAAGVVKGVAGAAKAGAELAPQAPSIDLKAVLRDAQRTVVDEIKAGITQVAAETVAPAARKATTSALVYVTTKGPGLVGGAVRTSIVPKLKEAGGPKAVAGAVLSRVPGTIGKVPGGLAKVSGVGRLGSMLSRTGKRGEGKAGEEPKGIGRGRRLPMQATIDVSVPVQVAYDQWTQFEELPKFMFRVERIEQKDDTHLIWHEKIWGVRREWEAEIVEQRPNERIVWRSTSGPRNVGVVSFHQLHDPRLSRVQVNLDFQPTGLIERTGSGWRAAMRALDTDLKRFKAFVEMKDMVTGAWRGRVEDAEVQGQEAEQGPTEAEGQATEAEGQATEAEEERQPAEAETKAPEAEEREQPDGESSEQWQVRRRAPGRPSRSRR